MYTILLVWMSKITNKFNAEIIIKISEFLLFSYIKITQQPLLKKIDPTINEKKSGCIF